MQLVVLGELFDLATHQIIADEQTPYFLTDTFWSFASQAFFALECVGLDFIVPELKLPTLVVENAHLICWIGLGIDKRGEERLWLKALALVLNRADDNLLRKFWPLFPACSRKRELKSAIPMTSQMTVSAGRARRLTGSTLITLSASSMTRSGKSSANEAMDMGACASTPFNSDSSLTTNPHGREFSNLADVRDVAHPPEQGRGEHVRSY